MKKVLPLIAIAIVFMLLFSGCLFSRGGKNPETGIYRCDELQLTLDFDMAFDSLKNARIETSTGEIEYYSINGAFTGYGLLDIHKVTVVSTINNGSDLTDTKTSYHDPYILGFNIYTDRKYDYFVWSIRGETEARPDIKKGHLYLFYRVK